MTERHAILNVPVTASGVASLRAQVRQVGELSGLKGLQQTHFSTAVSEIARNAVQYAGGGNATFLIGPSPNSQRLQCVIAEIKDAGPGISDLPGAMRGFKLPSGRQTMGIPGSARLVDRMAVEKRPEGGTLVRIEMDLPRLAPHLDRAALETLAGQLAGSRQHSLTEELEEQNRELLRVQQQLRDKQVALEEADLRKNHFVAMLAHELRNPLATLELSIAVLRLKPDLGAAELLKKCDVMARQSAQLSQLVNGLMDAASVSQGKVQLRRDRVELNDLAQRAVEMTGAATQARTHEVRVSVAPTPVWVLGDGPRLIQVLCNLLQNAARYTPEGGRIDIAVRQTHGIATVDVIDNGVGIAPNLMPHIFDLFVQGESRPGGAGGLGIGLALVRHLVNDHGGTVDVASEGSGRGSRFTITLPLAEEVGPPADSFAPPEDPIIWPPVKAASNSSGQSPDAPWMFGSDAETGGAPSSGYRLS